VETLAKDFQLYCVHTSVCLLEPYNFSTNTYFFVILPVVLYWRESWSFTLREEHILMMF